MSRPDPHGPPPPVDSGAPPPDDATMHFLWFFNALWITAVVVMLLAGFCSIVRHLAWMGKPVSDLLCRAPLLDGVVSIFTWVPWVVAAALGGGWGVVGAVLGQVIALLAWVGVHEWVYRTDVQGPRIVKVINRLVGRWQNHLALWVTLVALPGFLFIRFIEVAFWPLLVWLLNFPRYKQGDWVNCSRQKFEGLVGHDLIWCLYCDWMTGVYALGAEMLRNVESFWCPIRFYDGKKCDNCRADFPDIDGGWVRPNASMADVTRVLEEKYGPGERTWFGHPARLTVRGKEI